MDRVWRLELCRAPDGNEPDLDALVQRRSDPAQHRQRVPLVIRIFEAADDRRRGPDEFAKLTLRQARRCSQLQDPAGDLLIRSRLFQALQPARLACVEPAVKDLHCVTGWFRHSIPAYSQNCETATGSEAGGILQKET